MKKHNIQYVGNITELSTGTVVKRYVQTASGSAWKKVGTDVILLNEAGYAHIVLQINSDHPNKKAMLSVAKSIEKHFPNVKVQEITV